MFVCVSAFRLLLRDLLARPAPGSQARICIMEDSPSDCIERSHQETQDRYWGARASITERFPSMTGRVLWDMIVKIYVKEHGKVLKFYKVVDGTRIRLLYRHPRNNRGQKATRELYINSILEHGLLSHNRSSAFCVAPDLDDPEIRAMNLPDDPDVRLLFAHAHVAEATYDAEERCPDNIQVKRSIEGGIVGATDFKVKLPVDVIRYLKETNNQFHYGASTSFIELRLPQP